MNDLSAAIRTARCCCGQLQITVKGDPSINGLCHCADCRRRTGSAFGWSAYFEETQIIERRGAFTTYTVDAESKQERSFCPRCGTTLWWTVDARPGQVGVAGGAFVDPPLPTPSSSYRDAKRLDWVTIPENWAKVD